MRLAKPLKLLAPENNARVEGLDALKNGVALKWTAGGEGYAAATLKLFKVGSNGSETLFKTFDKAGETVSVPRLEAGAYKWTVSARTKGGGALDADAPCSFVVSAVPELAGALLVSPAQNQTLDAAYWKRNRSLAFRWEAVPNATDYSFALYQITGGGRREVYSSRNQNGTQASISDLKILDVGNFQWEVAAQNRAGDGFVYQSGKAAVQNFAISFDLPSRIETVEQGDMYGR